MSSTSDFSHTTLLKRKAGRIIAANVKENPVYPSSAVGALSQNTLVDRRVGQIQYTRRPAEGPAILEKPCDCPVENQ